MLLGGVPGVPPARIVVIGGGVVGTHAARMAAGLGAEVTDPRSFAPAAARTRRDVRGRVRTRFSTIEAIEEEVFAADVVIGAVLVPGASAPKLVTRAHAEVDAAGRRVWSMSRSTRAAASRPRTPPPMPSRPIEVDGIIHYCVANMPGAVPRHLEPRAQQRHAAVRPRACQARVLRP